MAKKAVARKSRPSVNESATNPPATIEPKPERVSSPLLADPAIHPDLRPLFHAVVMVSSWSSAIARCYADMLDLKVARGMPKPEEWPGSPSLERRRLQHAAWVTATREEYAAKGESVGVADFLEPRWTEIMREWSGYYRDWCAAIAKAKELAKSPAVATLMDVGEPRPTHRWTTQVIIDLDNLAGTLHPIHVAGDDGLGVIRCGLPPLPTNFSAFAVAVDKRINELRAVIHESPVVLLEHVRDALSHTGHQAERLAQAIERLERDYDQFVPECRAHAAEPGFAVLFYAPSTLLTGRHLDVDWEDGAESLVRPARREAIEATLALRTAIDNAIETVGSVARLMDSEAESRDIRWTTRVINDLRLLRGAILWKHLHDAYPSALPVPFVGVPSLLRERSRAIAEHMEQIKSAILAGVETSARPQAHAERLGSEAPTLNAPTLDVALLESVAERAAERALKGIQTGDDSDDTTPPAELPELGPRDRDIYAMMLIPGMTQTKAASELNRRFPGENWSQPRISEAMTRMKPHVAASSLPEKIVPARTRRPARTLDPAATEQGRRTDGRAHHIRERERQKAKDGDGEE